MTEAAILIFLDKTAIPYETFRLNNPFESAITSSKTITLQSFKYSAFYNIKQPIEKS